MGIVRTTYEIITEESAANGDAEECGWEDEEGTEYSIDEVIDLLERCEPSSTIFHKGIWYSNSGKYKNISYHLSDFSEDEEKEIFQSISRW
jgi:hypothetical protein